MNDGLDRRSYDTDASAEAQGNLRGVIEQLETVIEARSAQVRQAMADFQADGVSDTYQAAELRWTQAADEVRAIITLLRTTLENNDSTAQTTLARARAAVEAIG
ncbi:MULTISPECIES: pore-forming ESAT-6 family protein [unclassified Streptomyces]|uniref:Pore-forming ESAT-6 family protein n=1 Tax=Streptomyces johnsoniae TaxID=3075532 RepID=A0ABU2S359_9ACTN|nr:MULTISPECIES: pore-forming ESAT-6 family protein [unclassified Streptomyces]MDT0443428.1 pore-forming ESAT-6 family protein [Streptomyces sp. DSM 41886]ONK12166.1 hypothetical protein STBA_29050 [Streptomyces sp. MP131-18]